MSNRTTFTLQTAKTQRRWWRMWEKRKRKAVFTEKKMLTADLREKSMI